MKNITYAVKYLFTLVVTSFLFFSCQDQVTEEITSESARENILPYGPDGAVNHNPNTYVLVHGAWHPNTCWNDVKWLLERSGHTVVSVQLPGLGADNTPVETVTFQDHVDAVKEVVELLPQDVILVGHSYAGAVISQVAELAPQHIEKLVYINGFMPVNGEAVVQLALADTQSLVTQNLIIDGAVAFLSTENYGNALYNQALASPNPLVVSKANNIISQLRPHPVATLVTPLQLSSVYDNLPKIYISCLQDKAVTPASQQAMYSRFTDVQVYTIAGADHSPFISTPISLVNLLRKL